MAEDNATSARDVQRGDVLRGRRDAESTAAALARTTRGVSKVVDGLFGEEASRLSALFLRLRPGAARDSRPGERLAHHSGSPLERIRQHQVGQVRREELRQDSRDHLARGRGHSARRCRHCSGTQSLFRVKVD